MKKDIKLRKMTQKEINTIANMFPELEVKFDAEQWKGAAKQWWKAKYDLTVKKVKNEPHGSK